MTHFGRSGLRLLSLVLVTLPSLAMAQETPRFQDSLEVRVINVDVFVQDAQGNPVHGLATDDFQILEDGQPQPITNFAEYRSGSTLRPAPPQPIPGVPAPSPAETRQPRTIVFFVDAFNQPQKQREELFERIRTFMRNGLEVGDRAALYSWRHQVASEVPLTIDLQKVDDALVRIAGMQLPAEDAGADQVAQFLQEAEAFRQSQGDDTGSSFSAQMETTIRNCAEDYLGEMKRKTAALERMIDAMSGLEGRKILVYVAGRFPADTAILCQSMLRTPAVGPASFNFAAGDFSTDKLVNKVTETANASGVTFYPLRPRISERRKTMVEYSDESDLGASEEVGDTLVAQNDADALATLAERTGGRLAVGDGRIDDLLPEIVSDLNNYYSIGYRATSDGTDRERRITVRMTNPRLHARTRRAFVEKSRLSEVKDTLVANLFTEPVNGDLELELIAGEPSRDKRGRSILPVEIRIPLDQLIYTGSTPTGEVRLLDGGRNQPRRDHRNLRERQTNRAAPGRARLELCHLESRSDDAAGRNEGRVRRAGRAFRAGRVRYRRSHRGDSRAEAGGGSGQPQRLGA